MVTLSRILYDEIIAHCQRHYPKEACGLLAGARGVVAQIYTMRNVEDSPIGYSMDPREQLRVEKEMRAQGQQLVGIYHSHTATDAYPSSVDVSLVISSELAYVLVSLKDRAGPVMRSYRIEGTTVTPEEVRQV